MQPYPLQAPSIRAAEVVSTDPTNRHISIKWVDSEGTRKDVIVVTPPGSYSFPKRGERGLVISAGEYEYYIGKIEYNYASKIDGALSDPHTGEKLLAKLVRGGEVMISNLSKRTWLSITNRGDFSLMNGLNEGLKYFKRTRFMRLASMGMQFIGNGATSGIGSTMRDLPGLGYTAIPGTSGTPAVEAFLELAQTGIKIARAHLGEVSDTTLGVVQLSSFGLRLRAIVEVLAAAVTLGKIQIDEFGNIEATTELGQVSIEGRPVAGILLGTLISAVHPALFGDVALAWANIHIHSSSWGPTGAAITPLPPSALSVKVMVS